jgi:acyl-CoA thioesterase-1
MSFVFLCRTSPWSTVRHPAAARPVAAGRALVAGVAGAFGRPLAAGVALALLAAAVGATAAGAAPAAALAAPIAGVAGVAGVAGLAAPAAGRVTAVAGGARLELPSGEAVTLALPPGAALDTVAALAGGWIAAGTAPGGDGGGGSGSGGGAGRELLLLVGGTGAPGDTGSPAVAGLAPPGERTGTVRAEPLPLVEDGRLAGLVWLEGNGPRAYGVRYAAWDGARWSRPRTISAPDQGSQLALTAARLTDGSWLLAWSAFDGHDDEIVWSAGKGGSWTRPRRLTDNQVPDITPALAATGSGAVLAWSQLAGDGYRLLLARYQDGRWGEPAEVAPGGSLYPRFESSPGTGRLRIFYRDARPERDGASGWAALELGPGGRPRRLAATAGPGVEPAAAWTAWRPPAPAPSFPAQILQSSPPAAPLTAAPAPKDTGNPLYVAFGDSITSGAGDPKGTGYPGRLEGLLTASAKSPVTVINAGLPGETTAEGVSRIGSTLVAGATAVLLMEGTNDLNAKLSVDTIVQNLDLMARKAEARGIKTVLATVIPRLPTADSDPTNLATGTLAGALRDLAWSTNRALVDPFEVFFVLTPDAFSQDYVGGADKLHPNAAGYNLLAQTFADVLNGTDKIPPVTGGLSPYNGQQNVLPTIQVDVDVYDFGAGIDVANTHLLINGQAVGATPTGDRRKLSFRYRPPSPFSGVVTVGLQTQDQAQPPNTFSGTLAQFVVEGTVFLTGDINHDGIVDGLDLILFAYCFGAHRFDPNFRIYCDFNGDGIVDGIDLALMAANFGKRSF